MGKSLPSKSFLAIAVSGAALSRAPFASPVRLGRCVARIASASGTCEARITF